MKEVTDLGMMRGMERQKAATRLENRISNVHFMLAPSHSIHFNVRQLPTFGG